MAKIFNILTVTFAIIMCGSCIMEKEIEVKEYVEIGDTLPNFEVVMNNGETVTTESLRGENSMIVFFNTDCSDCREEFPVLQKFWEEYGDEITIVCVSRAEDAEHVSKYWEENGLTLPYSAQKDRAIYNLFATSIIPRIYISGPDLIVRQIYTDNPLATYVELQNAFGLKD